MPRAVGILLFLLATLCMGDPLNSTLTREKFSGFKAKYGRTYATAAEEQLRFSCFVKNLQVIQELSKNATTGLGINHLADLCPEEFQARYLSGYLPRNTLVGPHVNVTTLRPPLGSSVSVPSFDWRNTPKVVGPVKNQGSCGSCWAFAAVASMEGAWNKLKKPSSFLQLSEEFLVQCSYGTAGYGCNGGWSKNAILFVVNKGGIPSQSAYPYTSGNGATGNCASSTAMKKPSATFRNVAVVPQSMTETQLAQTLSSYSPFYIAVDARYWQYYTPGAVWTYCSNYGLNHAVNIVGVTPNYWIVRNSWGTSFGESGYIRMQFGANCNGLMSDAGVALA